MANTSKTVSGTTRAKSGRLSGKFWKLLGASTEKNQSRSMAEVNAAADYAKKAAGLDDEQLRKAAQLLNLKDLADASDIPQFLAIAREAAERNAGLRPFDVQLQGALRMLAGDVVEMATGEGKTLSGAIAAAGYAIGGRHVHVVTINDYLARRDAEWMGPCWRPSGSPSVGSPKTPRRPSVARPTSAMSPTRRSTRSASTCCATSWSPMSMIWSRPTRMWR